MVRVVVFEHFKTGVSQFVEVQALIRLNHHRQAVSDRRGFLEVLNHVPATVGRSHIGLTGQVIVGHVNFISRQQVAQVNHALLGIRRLLGKRLVSWANSLYEARAAPGSRLVMSSGRKRASRPTSWSNEVKPLR